MSSHSLDYEALFLEHLDFIDDVVRAIVIRRHLSQSEGDDLRSTVRLKLLERDYEALRRFEGRSSLRTYLRVVIERCFLDLRAAAWGKWRPSTHAQRLGPVAILLEQALVRDDMTFDAAAAMLRSQHQVTLSDAELSNLHRALPLRVKRQMVTGDAADDLLVSPPDQHDALVAHGAIDLGSVAELAVARALTTMAPDERALFRLHFLEGMKLSQIARLLGWEQKPLYRKLARVLAALRQALEGAGVTSGQIDVLVRLSDFDLARVLQDQDESGKPEAGPSKEEKVQISPSEQRTAHG